MLLILFASLPIFALILVGWIAAKANVLGAGATRELNRFVVYLALPALLFDIMTRARPEDVWHPGFIFAFAAGAAAVFLLVLFIRFRTGAQLADATISGLSDSYANTGFMGFPLIAAMLGGAGQHRPWSRRS